MKKKWILPCCSEMQTFTADGDVYLDLSGKPCIWTHSTRIGSDCEIPIQYCPWCGKKIKVKE